MEENNKNTEVIHEITPKFDFIYELGMPTGKKIKSTLFMLFIFVAGYVVYLVGKDKIGANALKFRKCRGYEYIKCYIDYRDNI